MAEYKSLYRKWRPKTFTDVFGQEHITKVLQNQVLNQKVSHAYLFCGSRGTGKTTCAKILAKAVNCEAPEGGNPCNKCGICTGIETGGIIDVIEIDGASNNRVDNIRELREDAAFTPGDSSKKVYIIDEVHMLTTEAFNALLKTLEEPPPHIIFILATTEVSKIPATILSRCQRHDFKRIPPEIIAERLRQVCDCEKIKIEKKAVDLISRLSGGALRDALSILEVSAANGGLQNSENTITFEYVSKISGYFDIEKMVKLCLCIKDGDAAGALLIFWDMYESYVDCNNFCASLLEMFRNIEVAKLAGDPLAHINLEKSEAEKIIGISKEFDSAQILQCVGIISSLIINLGRYTTNKTVAVELMIVEMCQKDASIQAKPEKTAASPAEPKQKQTPPAEPGIRYFDKYADLIEEIGKENKMIAPNLRGGKCVIDESAKKIVIYSENEFKSGILKEAKNTAVIQKNLEKFTSGGYQVEIMVQKPEDNNKPENQNSIDDILKNTEG